MIRGLGLDLADIDRIARLLGRHPDRARRRLFTAGERAYCDRRAEPARHFAARFAAKEAAYKALSGTEDARHIHWQDIEVANSPLDGRPTLLLHGRAARRAMELGVVTVHVTLTHSELVAAAVVVLESAAS
ncbi:MAG TPA: holo-ACP synthase [Gemmatimonadaceae bacterium]|nr:holo-ACP synthase [Gemmatimonadaceae bacterium]